MLPQCSCSAQNAGLYSQISESSSLIIQSPLLWDSAKDFHCHPVISRTSASCRSSYSESQKLAKILFRCISPFPEGNKCQSIAAKLHPLFWIQVSTFSQGREMSLMQKLGYMSTISVQVTTSNILIFIRILQLSESLNEPLVKWVLFFMHQKLQILRFFGGLGFIFAF